MATLNDLAVAVIKLGETLERVKREIEAMNDKQPKVWLTVEEAQAISDRIDWCWQNSWGDMARLDKKLWNILRQRIEQAEGKE